MKMVQTVSGPAEGLDASAGHAANRLYEHRGSQPRGKDWLPRPTYILMPNVKHQSTEYIKFSTALNRILKVSYSEMQAKLEAEKKAKGAKPRPSSDHVSRERR